MAMLGADFADMISSRKKFVDATDEVQEAASGLGQAGAGAVGEGGGDPSAGGHSAGEFTPKSATGFVGLANQGATCYLNSLVQAMFMLPAFRAAVLSWKYDPAVHGDERRSVARQHQQCLSVVLPLSFYLRQCLSVRFRCHRSVARQLQRLFAALALSDRHATTTTSLTGSFGWSAGQQFEQQDVMECKTVILEHLAAAAAGTPLGDHMAQCHSGSTCRVLRCSGCGSERPRSEDFRDLQLDVKDFNQPGSSQMEPQAAAQFGSIARSLAAYFAPEKIEGVQCEGCGGPKDHEKLLGLEKLPYFLPLALKRFAMNYTTVRASNLPSDTPAASQPPAPLPATLPSRCRPPE
eukprot:SAG22_NODE_56_length_23716_cov_11.146759_13_plen_350_part_00